MISLIKHRLSQIYSIARGYIYKYKIDIFGLRKLKPLQTNHACDELIVSLTSFGRRVNKVVFYTLVSLLQQTTRPNRIILWIDDKKWNENNLPKSLKNLKDMVLK